MSACRTAEPPVSWDPNIAELQFSRDELISVAVGQRCGALEEVGDRGFESYSPRLGSVRTPRRSAGAHLSVTFPGQRFFLLLGRSMLVIAKARPLWCGPSEDLHFKRHQS